MGIVAALLITMGISFGLAKDHGHHLPATTQRINTASSARPRAPISASNSSSCPSITTHDVESTIRL
ncbi:hypothetical protein ABIB85_007404 [Bradyrhizobium sp. JR1.5]|uniref:hypothetical protein n=1 Tax=unclassified Bradyrhizobium TaxID=2631580 RepID=UPI0024478176|nr:hypothetical protein [Bradyrhizobium sp. SSUT18]MDH2399166.1 hypothetical protein [Bradyrhizobium sp. SSUT18]